ncbi:hypothetical protein BDN70DRAFT_288906 [Pholiota conissans]|uniref:Uncharacterized protein n=1 Tax=Pholiota conissans TaxID=109636 RepID=A0A9P6CPN0_9AGAR|nr:hypothetical protein BDN70DRAFT_288906 [Pholiota conissans]
MHPSCQYLFFLQILVKDANILSAAPHSLVPNERPICNCNVSIHLPRQHVISWYSQVSLFLSFSRSFLSSTSFSQSTPTVRFTDVQRNSVLRFFKTFLLSSFHRSVLQPPSTHLLIYPSYPSKNQNSSRTCPLCAHTSQNQKVTSKQVTHSSLLDLHLWISTQAGVRFNSSHGI